MIKRVVWLRGDIVDLRNRLRAAWQAWKEYPEKEAIKLAMQAYDLDVPTKGLYPVMDLKNLIPRIAKHAVEDNWRRMTEAPSGGGRRIPAGEMEVYPTRVVAPMQWLKKLAHHAMGQCSYRTCTNQAEQDRGQHDRCKKHRRNITRRKR